MAKTQIKASGPFFTADPAKTLRQNMHVMMQKLAKAGMKDVRSQLRAGRSDRAPVSRLGHHHVVDYVFGELRRYPPGPKFTARVIVRNRGLTAEQGKSLMAAASQLEGEVHAFRKTKGRILRTRIVNAAELLKGIR
jgi:hypothetical protein